MVHKTSATKTQNMNSTLIYRTTITYNNLEFKRRTDHNKKTLKIKVQGLKYLSADILHTVVKGLNSDRVNHLKTESTSARVTHDLHISPHLDGN